MQNRLLLVIGIFLILLSLAEVVVRKPDPYVRVVYISEPVPVVPQVFIEATSTPLAQPTCTCALALESTTTATATITPVESVTDTPVPTPTLSESATPSSQALVVGAGTRTPVATPTAKRP